MPSGIDDALRHELSRALLHHLNGGMHNAALALELVSRGAADAARATPDHGPVADAGLRGLAQATRTLQLVAALWGLPPKPDIECSVELVDDAVHALSACARRRGVDFKCELDRVARACLDFDQVVAMMGAAVVAIERAPQSARVRMRAGAGERGAPVAFEVERGS